MIRFEGFFFFEKGHVYHQCSLCGICVSYPRLADQSVVPDHFEHWPSHFCLTGGSTDCPEEEERGRKMIKTTAICISCKPINAYGYTFSFHTHTLFISQVALALTLVATSQYCINLYNQYCLSLYQPSLFTLDCLSSASLTHCIQFA